jgi:hypothetical protein
MDAFEIIVLVAFVVASVDWLVYRIRRAGGREVKFWYCPRCKMAIPCDDEGGEVICRQSSN